MPDCSTLLPVQDEIVFACDAWRCSICHCSELDNEWILYQMTWVKQEGTRDTIEERPLTLILNRDVLTHENNVDWLRGLFLDRWLDHNLTPYWKISKMRGLEMLAE